MCRDDGERDDGTFEFSIPRQYASKSIDIRDALPVENGIAEFLQTTKAVLEKDFDATLSEWFAYCESRADKHYLDAIFRNLLTCAENVYHLLPDKGVSESRSEQYDTLMTLAKENERVLGRN